MLVLSRKTGEKIQIGDNVLLSVIEIRGNRVRLGIEAPLDVRVLRSELNEFANTFAPDKNLEIEIAT